MNCQSLKNETQIASKKMEKEKQIDNLREKNTEISLQNNQPPEKIT